jgi:hypothetical protein
MEVFFSYAHEDEALCDKLAKHLKLLERQGVITAWHDRDITAGEEWKDAIDNHLESANIILLLVSSDFLASDYCYDIELKRALERHESNQARVIPVILRSVDWHGSTFGKLVALPKDGKAITSWQNEDEAFTDVVKGLRRVIDNLQGTTANSRSKINPSTSIPHNLPRSGVVKFVGRAEKLEQLHTQLQQSDRIAITAIAGMGGIGKTELALQYAIDRLQQGQYPAGLCWLRTRDREIATDYCLQTFTTFLDIRFQIQSEQHGLLYFQHHLIG